MFLIELCSRKVLEAGRWEQFMWILCLRVHSPDDPWDGQKPGLKENWSTI